MNKSLKEKIIELKNQGCSYNQIKEKLGCSKGTIAYHIGIGQKEKTDKRRQESRTKVRRYIQEYKANKKCADCGEDYPYWMMEFDHLKDKNFTIGQFSSKTVDIEIVKKEISKCEVVCSNCHRNRTFNRSLKNGDGVDWDNDDDQQPRTKEAANMSDENERSVASDGSHAVDICDRLRIAPAKLIGTVDEDTYWACHEAADKIDRMRLTDKERVDVAMWLSECLRQCSLATDGGNEEVAERWRHRSERAARMLERLK